MAHPGAIPDPRESLEIPLTCRRWAAPTFHPIGRISAAPRCASILRKKKGCQQSAQSKKRLLHCRNRLHSKLENAMCTMSKTFDFRCELTWTKTMRFQWIPKITQLVGWKYFTKLGSIFFQKQEGLFKKIAIMKMMGPPGPRLVPIFKNASPDGRLLPKRKTGGWFPPTSKHRETPTRCPCCRMKLFNSGGLTGNSRFQKTIRNTEVATFAAEPLIIFWWFQTTKRKCHNRIQLIQCLFEKA